MASHHISFASHSCPVKCNFAILIHLHSMYRHIVAHTVIHGFAIAINPLEQKVDFGTVSNILKLISLGRMQRVRMISACAYANIEINHIIKTDQLIANPSPSPRRLDSFSVPALPFLRQIDFTILPSFPYLIRIL